MDFLSSFEAENIDMTPIPDRKGMGMDKLRILFEIKNKEKAEAVYNMIAV